jgi:uncharacterized protein (TIGR02147 family)
LESADLRFALRDVLAKRCAKNPRYSLRAFAKSLGTDHSTLSQVLRGRRVLGVRTIERYAARLGFSDEQCQAFVVAERGRRRDPDDAQQHIRRLGRDVTILLSDRRHFAILELTRLESFQADSRWLARVLGCSVDDVNIAVQRLIRFGLLDMTNASRWTTRAPSLPLSFSDFVDAIASQLAGLSAGNEPAHAWDLRPRDRSTTTLAVDARRVNAAIEIMERCRNEVTKMLSAGNQKDDVYRLEISLTPVTTAKP